jgi:hypothetical protein
MLIPFSVDSTSTPQPPTHTDQAYFEISKELDFNVQNFMGTSPTDFITGMTDTEMNFNWVSSDPAIAFQ